jgi:hypothetical protein
LWVAYVPISIRQYASDASMIDTLERIWKEAAVAA